MTFTNRVVSITQDTILPKVVDNILSGNFITFRFISNGKKWSGETLKRPIMIAKNTLGGSFAGLDTHNTGTVETRITMSYDVRGYQIPVAIPGMEAAVNNVSETQVLNLIKTETETAMLSALDNIGTILYGDGTGNSNKEFIGLDALDDDGTSVVTIGNQSRTTYSALQGTRTASGGTMTLTKLSTLYSAVSGGSAVSERPTFFLSSETEFNYFESLLQPTVRSNYDAVGMPVVTRTSKGTVSRAELKGGMGYTALHYKGIPWISDEKAPTGTVWLLNETYLDWYGLNDPKLSKISLGSSIEGVYNDVPSENTGFQWTGFMRPINQYGEVGHIYLLGNMTTFQPRRHGRLTGITGV